MFPKMSACRTDFEETKYVFFFLLIKDDELLEKHNKVLDKVSKVIKKDFTVSLYTMKNN